MVAQGDVFFDYATTPSKRETAAAPGGVGAPPSGRGLPREEVEQPFRLSTKGREEDGPPLCIRSGLCCGGTTQPGRNAAMPKLHK